MKTIKIIDLLNKIANGEEVPKKIKFCLRTFVFVECDYICLDSNTDLDNCNGLSIHKWIYSNNLNDEVEIIEEEKEIEKLDENNTNVLTNIIENRKKINELIDAVNELKRGN